MSNFVCLVEIFEVKCLSTADSEERRAPQYSLREIYVNPSHIISLKDNEKYHELLKRGAVVKGLDKRQSFTNLSLVGNDHTAHTVTVVGAPSTILQKMNGK